VACHPCQAVIPDADLSSRPCAGIGYPAKLSSQMPTCHPGFIPGSVVQQKKTPQQVRGDIKKSPG